MPILLPESEGPAAAADEPGELEPGQQAYEAVAAVVGEADELTIMALLGVIQRGDPWPRVPPQVRQLLAALEAELFDDAGPDGG